MLLTITLYKMTTKTKLLLSLLSVFVFVTSCKKMDLTKLAGGSWNPDLAIPIGKGTFDFKSLVPISDTNNLFVVDPFTGLMSINLRNKIYSLNSAELLDIAAQSFSSNWGVNDLGIPVVPNLPSSVTQVIVIQEMIDFNGDADMEIDRVLFESGDLDLTVLSTFKQNLDVVLEFTDFKESGVSITRSFNLNYTGNASETYNTSIPLAGVLADMTAGGTSTNKFRMKLSLVMTGANQAVTEGDAISLSFVMSDLNFEEAYGYFGNQMIEFNSDTLKVEALSANLKGSMKLTNPIVKFYLESGIGMPANFSIDKLDKINLEDGTTISLTGFQNPYVIQNPTALNTTKTTTIVLDKSTTPNIAELVALNPFSIITEAEFNMNPAGNTGTLNFLQNSSKLVIDMETEIPMEGYGYGIQFEDTLDFNPDIEFVESAMFRLITDNRFPLTINTQVYFLDENYQVLFQLFENVNENIIDGAPVGSDGFVNGTSHKQTDANLTSSKLVLLPDVRKIRLVGVAETTNSSNQQSVKICDYNSMDIKLSAQIKVKMNTKL